jgi:hypothetical protein
VTEIEVEVTGGRVRAVFMQGTLIPQEIITGPAWLMGWSYGDLWTTVPGNKSGQVTAPAAGAVIADMGLIAGEAARIDWTVGLAGAAAAGDADNFGLYVGGVLVSQSVNPGAAGSYPQTPYYAVIGAPADIEVKAIGAGTAGVTYAAQLNAMPAFRDNDQYIITDGDNQIAVISGTPDLFDTRWFGPQGIYIQGTLRVHPNPGFGIGTFFIRYERE